MKFREYQISRVYIHLADLRLSRNQNHLVIPAQTEILQNQIHPRHSRAGGNPVKTKTLYTKYFEELFLKDAGFLPARE
jgi:hypothetical protein